jgi:large subunit ribosomal protein L5
MLSLKEHYQKVVVPQLIKDYGYNVMQVPKIHKITLNAGLGKAVTDRGILTKAASDFALITGQKPLITKVKRSVASFKIREGWPIGCKVTLRGKRMYDFLTRFLFLALPRTRDFRGLARHSFDGRGNYSLGVKEHIIFPEISYGVDSIGMDICVTTSANTDAEAFALLQLMQFPFRG